MKRAWIIRRDEEAVSPVIATILMVAITVVLAAVLYVMVTGVIPPEAGVDPRVTFGSPASIDGNWKISVDGTDRSESISNYKVLVMNGTTVVIAATGLENCVSSACTGGGLSLQFTDIQADSKLNVGDFFLLSGTDSTSDYTITLLWKQSGNKVQESKIIQ